MLLPESTFKLIWGLLLVTCLVFTGVYIPIRITFLDEVPFGMLIFEYIIDGFFFLDIFINLISAYYDENHKLIDDPKTIAKSYLKGWFLVDAIAW